MHRLIYLSTALIPADGPETLTMLRTARTNNAKQGLTGFLHREGDIFLQVLEGDSYQLERLMGNLLRDPRHCDVLLRVFEPISERDFAQWDCGHSGDAQISFSKLLHVASDRSSLESLSRNDLMNAFGLASEIMCNQRKKSAQTADARAQPTPAEALEKAIGERLAEPPAFAPTKKTG